MGDKKDKKDKKKDKITEVLEINKKSEKKKAKNLGDSDKLMDHDAARELELTTTRLNVSCGQYGGYSYSPYKNNRKTNVNISLDVPHGVSVQDVYNTPTVQDRINTQLGAWDAGKLDAECMLENISYGVTFPYEIIQDALNKKSENIIDTTFQEVSDGTITAGTAIDKFDKMIEQANSNGAKSLKVTEF